MFKKAKFVFISVICFFISVISGYAQDSDSITIVTYYPSPYGVYREMRAQRMAIGDDYIKSPDYCWGAFCGTNIIPDEADLVVQGNVGIGISDPASALDVNGAFSVRNMAQPALAPAGQGRIYFDSLANKFKVSENAQAYVDLLGGGGGAFWADSGNNIYNTNLGNVGVGTASPQAKLDVSYSGTQLRLTRGSAYSDFKVNDTGWLTIEPMGGSLVVDGTLRVNDINPTGTLSVSGGLRLTTFGFSASTHVCKSSSGQLSTCSSDISEYAPMEENVETGDLVAVSKERVNSIGDPEAPFLLEKSSQPYQQNLISVVGDIANGASLGEKKAQHYKPLVLGGRVPVKVTNENGPIEVGDWLTSSSIPGVAMKATHSGSVIGKALEAYNSEKIGIIMVFIDTGWYGGSSR